MKKKKTRSSGMNQLAVKLTSRLSFLWIGRRYPHKIYRWVPLRSSDRKTTKGELRYSAEFYPSLALPPSAQVPERDLHDCPIRRTPDDLVDLFAYNSGILTVKIHEVKLPHSSYAYCALIVDSLLPQFTTTKLKGRTLTFNETSDAFVKEADFSRVAIEVKPADATEKSDEKLGFWIGKVSDIVRQIQRKRRSKPLVVDEQDNQENQETEDDGEWFQLLGTMGGPGRIRLSFDFVPLINFTLDPSESLDNQGQLTVTLLDGKNLMAVDKSGTSDPYVVFTVNGTEVHKSEAIKKTVNPVWKNETFTVPIVSIILQPLVCNNLMIELLFLHSNRELLLASDLKYLTGTDLAGVFRWVLEAYHYAAI